MNHSFRTLGGVSALVIVGTAIAVTTQSSELPVAPTYVGQQTCMQSGCHEDQTGDGAIYRGAGPFLETMHQKIHLRPNPQTVILEKYFAGDSVLTSIVSVDGVVDTLDVHLHKQGADYLAQMRLRRSGDSTPLMKVEYTYGGNGWIQRYLVGIGGSYYILPFQYVLPAYADRGDHTNTFVWLDLRRWMIGDPNGQPATVTFLPMNTNTFRSRSWDANCAVCHVNGWDLQITVNGSDTTWTSVWPGKGVDSATQDINLGIGCESCHGPGSDHAANPTATNIVSPGRFPITKEGTDLKLDNCLQCHNRNPSTGRTHPYPYNEAIGNRYDPGARLAEYIFGGDRMYGGDIWPDSTSHAHRQHGQDYLRSSKYHTQVLRDGCWGCHKVHYNTPFPYQLDRDWYSLSDGEGCLSCHGSDGPGMNPPLEDMSKTEMRNDTLFNVHTRHSQPVSQCVNCHMTKSASIAFAATERKPYFEFAAHHFSVIRPSLTLGTPFPIGQINTCAEACHRNGRGSRNYTPPAPEAPSFGIVDGSVVLWQEQSDVRLADSLWKHYQRMYAGVMGIRLEKDRQATSFAITSAAPNPFTSLTTMRIELPRNDDIRLTIHDLSGRMVRLLVSGDYSAGVYSIEWDGLGEMGSPLAAGTYIARLESDRQGSSTMKLQVRK